MGAKAKNGENILLFRSGDTAVPEQLRKSAYLLYMTDSPVFYCTL
jgi:hypothetical protein